MSYFLYKLHFSKLDEANWHLVKRRKLQVHWKQKKTTESREANRRLRCVWAQGKENYTYSLNALGEDITHFPDKQKLVQSDIARGPLAWIQTCEKFIVKNQPYATSFAVRTLLQEARSEGVEMPSTRFLSTPIHQSWLFYSTNQFAFFFIWHG